MRMCIEMTHTRTARVVFGGRSWSIVQLLKQFYCFKIARCHEANERNASRARCVFICFFAILMDGLMAISWANGIKWNFMFCELCVYAFPLPWRCRALTLHSRVTWNEYRTKMWAWWFVAAGTTHVVMAKCDAKLSSKLPHKRVFNSRLAGLTY